MSAVAPENFQCQEVDGHPRQLEALQLAANDEEEVVVLSPTLVYQPQRRKSLRMVLFLSIAVVAIAIVGVIITSRTPNAFAFGSAPTESSETSTAAPTESSETSTATPTESSETSTADCPLPSTKSSDIEFLLEGWKTAGCHRMECLSDKIRQNTRDRLGHGSAICIGQALCNGDDEKFPGVLFQFGLTSNGALVWQKCDPSDPSQTEIITLVTVPAPEHNSELHNTNTNNAISSSVMTPPQNQLWFEMTSEATWQILSTTSQEENSTTTNETDATATATATATSGGTATTLVWEQPVQNQPRPVGVTSRCLSDRPVMDCPYIHFRRHGDIVMNYIDSKDGWIACKSRKICYSSLWE